MSTSSPVSYSDLKEYIKAKLGDDVVNIEMSDTQFEIVINDALQKFFDYTFDGYEELYMQVSLPSGTSEIFLEDSILNVINVYGSKTFLNNIVSFSVYNAENLYMNRKYTFNFSKVSKKLIVNENVYKDTYLMVHVYKKLDTVSYAEIYNHPWLKKYATALAKYQWGQNIIKYGNVILPGQMQLNADKILDEGKREIEECEKELYESYAFFPLPQVL
jgi:hypothetical protein